MHVYTHIYKCIYMIYIYYHAFLWPYWSSVLPAKIYTLLRPSGGSAGSCSRTAAQQWVNAVAAQHSRRIRQQQWVEGLSGGAKAPPASPAPRPCMGPNESGLDAGARLKTPRPTYIYIYIYIHTHLSTYIYIYIYIDPTPILATHTVSTTWALVSR
jgi:hypothetical protein